MILTRCTWTLLTLIAVPHCERPATHLLNCVMVIERLSCELYEEQLERQGGGLM